VKLDFIRPGKPVENCYIESFNGKLRDECLNMNLFFTLAQVEQTMRNWLHDYNHVRPHRPLGGAPPSHTGEQITHGVPNPDFPSDGCPKKGVKSQAPMFGVIVKTKRG
jgi:putative transposase